MTIEVDVKSMSREQVSTLLKELLDANMIDKKLLEDVILEHKELNIQDSHRLKTIVDRHFSKYDEVFRKLA